MRIAVKMVSGGHGSIDLERPDSDGDVYLSAEGWGWYFDRQSALRGRTAPENRIRDTADRVRRYRPDADRFRGHFRKRKRREASAPERQVPTPTR